MSEAHAAHTKVHDYHLVDPSPWPFLGAMAGLLMAVGGVMFMHDNPVGWLVLLVGFLCVLGVMAGWWRDVIKESVQHKAHTGVVQIGLRMGMVLFIASEVMFFVAFFWAYFNASLFPTAAVGGVWPPEGIETFDPWHLPLMNTTILLLSGTTVTWAHHALREFQGGDGLLQVPRLTPDARAQHRVAVPPEGVLEDPRELRVAVGHLDVGAQRAVGERLDHLPKGLYETLSRYF